MISDRGSVQRYSAVSRLNDIDLRDIESIEIIKGPAAATLYGTEASNGVIQIVTKRGEVGAPVFDLTAETGAMWLPERYITEGWIPDPALCPFVPCASVDQTGQHQTLSRSTRNVGLVTSSRMASPRDTTSRFEGAPSCYGTRLL